MTPRRPPGEGTVYRTRDGRWRYAVTLPSDGRGQIRRYGSATTEAEARARLRLLLIQHAAGTVQRRRPPTVEAWLTTWLDTIAARRVKPTTLHGYRAMTMAWLIPVLGRVALDKLQPEHVEHLHAVMADAGLSSATCLQAHRILARALRVAQQRGHVARNVAAIVDAPSLDRTERDYLRTAEIAAIAAAAADSPVPARWALAFLGLRQGEVLGLAWPDVDLDAGVLTVTRALSRLPGVGLIVSPPKTRASAAPVALPGQVVRMLRAHRVRQLEARVEDGPNWRPWTPAGGDAPIDLVFTQRSGAAVDPRADARAWKALCVAAGVRVVEDSSGRLTSTVRLHDARHATATTLRTQGFPTKVIQAMLRHASPAITAALYEHVVPEVQADAAGVLGDRLFGSADGS